MTKVLVVDSTTGAPTQLRIPLWSEAGGAPGDVTPDPGFMCAALYGARWVRWDEDHWEAITDPSSFYVNSVADFSPAGVPTSFQRVETGALVSAGTAIVASVSPRTLHPDGLGYSYDELEMDPIIATAYRGDDGFVVALLSSLGGPVSGGRSFSLILHS